MHVRNADGRLSGHVERIAAGRGCGHRGVAEGTAMKLSARNVLKGRVVKVVRGQTTAHVKIDVGGGSIVTASVTVEAVDELGLREGDAAYAVIKASDVMVAKD
jgi:molybdopterin-binding protein